LLDGSFKNQKDVCFADTDYSVGNPSHDHKMTRERLDSHIKLFQLLPVSVFNGHTPKNIHRRNSTCITVAASPKEVCHRITSQQISQQSLEHRMQQEQMGER
jgi:hypothetical protein